MIEPVKRSLLRDRILVPITDQIFPWLNYGPQVCDVFMCMLLDIRFPKWPISFLLNKEIRKWNHTG
jgi:hypothetical protein